MPYQCPTPTCDGGLDDLTFIESVINFQTIDPTTGEIQEESELIAEKPQSFRCNRCGNTVIESGQERIEDVFAEWLDRSQKLLAAHREREEKARATCLAVAPEFKEALLARFRELGVSTVLARYDGIGDEGFVEEMAATTAGGTVVAVPPDLRELMDQYVCWTLPVGWNVDDGSFGTYVLDVRTGTARVEHTERFYNPASDTLRTATDTWEA